LLDFLWNIDLLTQLQISRIGLSFLCGWALALSGCIFQNALQNRLAEPSLLGVSAGAALASLLVIYFDSTVFVLPWWFSAYGIIGGTAIASIVLICQYFFHMSNERILLLGIAIGAVVIAVIQLMLFYANAWQLQEYLHWTYGSFAFATLQDLFVLFPLVVLSSIFVIYFNRELNCLGLGAKQSFYLGVPYYRWQIIFLTAATLLASVTVALAGILPFVALLIPNAIRLLVKDFKTYLVVSGFTGAFTLLLLDQGLEKIGGEMQIPVGIILSLLGLPFLITELCLQSRRKSHA
jgi:ABC-type Fe3+-siderophore transport system permease subunit